MKSRIAAHIILSLMLLWIFVPGSEAQSKNLQSQISFAPQYRVASEVRLWGTIIRIEPNGAIAAMGSRIMIQTARGAVEVDLGFGRWDSAASLGLSTGELVSVTGVMQNSGGVPILLARILGTPTRVAILRNEHGIPTRAARPESASIGSAARGNI